MREKGFSLVELIVTMALIVTMLGIAMLSWRDMNTKSAVEGQIKKLHADLMQIRLQALYSKTPRSVLISGNQFKVYSSNVTTVPPITTTVLRYPVRSNQTGALTFDAQGLMNANQRSMCIAANAPAAVVDSIVVSQARINLGKRTSGVCADGNVGTIEQK